MASKTNMVVSHGALEAALGLPEGVWISTITRVPAGGKGVWNFHIELRSTDEDEFPDSHPYVEPEFHGSATLYDLIPLDTAAAS